MRENSVFVLIYSMLFKANLFISKMLARLAALVIIVMSLIIFAQVVMRYVFNRPFEWAEEAAIYMMVFMTFLCLPYLVMKNKNIAMTFISDKLKGTRLGYVLELIITLSFLFVIVLWLPLSFKLFINSRQVMAFQLPISRGVLHFIVPVSFVLMGSICIQQLIKEITCIYSTATKALFAEIENTDKNDVLPDDTLRESNI